MQYAICNVNGGSYKAESKIITLWQCDEWCCLQVERLNFNVIGLCKAQTQYCSSL